MGYKLLDIKGLKTYSIKDRKSKVSIEKSAIPPEKGKSFREFVNSLPDFLAAKDIRSVASAIVEAHKNNRPVILGMGAHAIKVGLSPIIINLMQQGIITAIATNGACIIHDFEISYIGQTSEDVATELCTGTFGMAKETGQMLNGAISDGVGKGLGIGRSIGEFIDASDFQFKDNSIFRAGFNLDIPRPTEPALEKGA